MQYQLLYLSAVRDSGQSELLLPCMEVVLLVQGVWKPPWTASPSCAHALQSQHCKYKFTSCFEVCIFFTLRPMTYFLKVMKWVMQWKTSRIYPKHKRKPIFHSQFCHLLVFISEVQIWDFFSLFRRRRAELNKSAAICSLKIKFEANQHKSSNVLHRRCSSFFFFV